MPMGSRRWSSQEDSLEGRPLSRLQEAPLGWGRGAGGGGGDPADAASDRKERRAFLKAAPVIAGCGPAFLLSGVKDRARAIIQGEAIV